MVWLHDRIAADATWRAGEDAFPLGPGIRRRGDRLHHDLDRVPGTLDGGRFLTSFHAAGWAHWVLDVLPRLVVDAELPPDLHRHPLLVPKFATQRPRYRESLETFVDPDALVGLEHERLTRVRELVWLDGARPFVHKDFRTADVPEGVPLGFHARTMARFREAVRAAHAVGIRPDPDRRIQLVRRDGARNEASRRHNDAELEAVARREGFEAFVLERLPFAEQVALLASAGRIVGPYGAAWTLSFFSAPGARARMVRPRSMVQRWLYPTLARISGLELRAL
ncbi:MAG: glycosyltransferase family 61 protein, partial [Planctomycetota bacterium]